MTIEFEITGKLDVRVTSDNLHQNWNATSISPHPPAGFAKSYQWSKVLAHLDIKNVAIFPQMR